MNSKFDWKDVYALENDDIDSQHKELLAYARRFELSNSKDEALVSLMDVYRYTREHFTSEENYMKNIQYDKYEDHRSTHDNLIQQFNTLVSDFDNSAAQRKTILAFLEDWVLMHIATEDKKIASFVKQHH